MYLLLTIFSVSIKEISYKVSAAFNYTPELIIELGKKWICSH